MSPAISSAFVFALEDDPIVELGTIILVVTSFPKGVVIVLRGSSSIPYYSFNIPVVSYAPRDLLVRME